MKAKIKITVGLLVIGLSLLLFFRQFAMFAEAEDEIFSARQTRLVSALLAEELMRSCDELTREVRNFAVSSDPDSKARYEEIIDVREGLIPRGRVTDQSFMDVIEDTGIRTQVDDDPLLFIGIVRQSGLSIAEVEALEKAKLKSDALIEVERAVFSKLDQEIITPEMRIEALEILVSDEYLAAKSDIRSRIREFEVMVRNRMEASAAEARERCSRIRFSLIGLGVLVAGLVLGWMLVEVTRAARFEGCVRRDALTDLASRSYLHEYLGKVTANAEARGEIVLMAFIDLNGFKRINDRFGHEKGDELLRVIANCLHDECRTRDLVARYGGDEFVVVFFSPMNQRSESISRMNQIIERAFREVRAKEGYGEIGASAGISVFPCPAVSVDDLIRKADEAMYRAKKSGKPLAICIHKEDHTLVCRFPGEVSAG